MITDIDAERLVIVSDLHLGNPASEAAGPFREFLDFVQDEHRTLVINGDGFEMLQTRFGRVVREALPLMSRITRMRKAGLSVYYVVGNHDIYMEHFLDDWMVTGICPFLNVTSGGKRIRIEHGHLYDIVFSRAPEFYEAATRFLGLFILAKPDVYKLWDFTSRRIDGRRANSSADERDSHHRAAAEVLRRGFDVVVHGHTHRAEMTQMERGLYVNSGAWLHGGTYVEVDSGRIELKDWGRA